MNRKQRRAEGSRQKPNAPSLAAGVAFEQAMNEGLRSFQAGQLDGAAAAFRKVTELNPSYAMGHSNLGVVLKAQGKVDEAVECYRRAIALDPNVSEAHNNLGLALSDLDRHEEAIVSLSRAVALQPDNSGAFVNMTHSLVQLGRYDEAVAAGHQAVKLKPGKAKAHSNLGMVLTAVGQIDAAVSAYRKAVELEPNLAMAHKNLGLALLLQGQFPEGWREYEWRWAADQRAPRKHTVPVWLGGPLAGKTILLYAEQGLGDAIQFARFSPILAAAGARVVFEVHKPLMHMMRNLEGVADVVGLWDPTPPFDCYQALMTVPAILGVTTGNIPARVPYLSADPARVTIWRERLKGPGFKVGIVWRGKGETTSQRSRSVTLASFAPLAKIPGVRLISLQKQDAGEAPDPLLAELSVETLGPDFDAGPDAFIDTAAVMENLDLIVTIDTSLAHLAGALARPVWIALKKVPDWRWLMEGERSAWHPTARLFRQPALDQWSPVFAEIARELTALVQARV